MDARRGVLAGDDDSRGPAAVFQILCGRGDERPRSVVEAGGRRRSGHSGCGREGGGRRPGGSGRETGTRWSARDAARRRGRLDGVVADGGRLRVVRGRPAATRELAGVGEMAGAGRRAGRRRGSRRRRPSRSRTEARRAVRRRAARLRGRGRARPASHWCHFAFGSAARSDVSWSASVGEVTAPVRIRSPSPWRPRSDFILAPTASVRAPPGPDLPELGDRLRAVGIVETEDRGLPEDVGRAEARRVVGVPLDLRRAARVALDEKAGRVAGERKRGGEEERPAGKDLFGLADVRDDLLPRLPRAGGQPPERERGARKLKKAAARESVVPLGGVDRELARQELRELRRSRPAPRDSATTCALRALSS